jgi:pimeloyl-ACP methyl ester carboxylesterase
MWFSNVADLTQKFHVLAVDTVGEPGKSIPSRQNATRRAAAAWLEEVLDGLGIAKTCVMGLSRGGWLALNLAHFAAHRLEKMVLLSPAASFIPLSPFFSAVAAMVMRIPTQFVAKMALNSWVGRGFVVNPVFAEQFMVGLVNWNWVMNTNGYSGVMPSAFGDEELRQIHLPVLMLIGDQDRLNPPRAIERARQLIPHIEAEIIPRAGHFLSMEQPEAVNRRVLQFLLPSGSTVKRTACWQMRSTR